MGMYIKVTVTPNSKKEAFIQTSDDSFELKIREKAERNLANTRVLDVFKKHYKGKTVNIISGHHSRQKILSIN
jgi:uncharacterized protein (TIGR00251 family)